VPAYAAHDWDDFLLREDWNVVDALYFAVATLTTSIMTAPDLVLGHDWMKLFTVFYVLLGIGILVEIVRRLGFAFVSVRASDDKAKDATRGGSAEGRGHTATG
jgi:Ion channel